MHLIASACLSVSLCLCVCVGLPSAAKGNYPEAKNDHHQSEKFVCVSVIVTYADTLADAADQLLIYSAESHITKLS